MSGGADPKARWCSYLSALEAVLADTARVARLGPFQEDLGPLPPELAERAARALEALRAAEGKVRARRGEVAARLATMAPHEPPPSRWA